MSYKRKERDAAIMNIGLGKVDWKNLLLYEDLEKFGWIVIARMNGVANKVELSFWGTDLFRLLQKNLST